MGNRNIQAVAIYDRIAEEYAKEYDSIDDQHALVFLHTFLAYFKEGSSIIDLGCGTGFPAGYFVRKGMKVEGVDASSGMIAIARRNYPNVPFVLADMRTFHPGEKADGVWAGYSLFHFEQTDFEKMVRLVRTYLKPSGIFGMVMQEGVGESREMSSSFRKKRSTSVCIPRNN